MAKPSEKDSGYFKTGDLVIGTSDPSKSVYSATGAKINNDGVSIYGDLKDLTAQTEEITLSAMRSGGTPMMTQTKTKKNSKRPGKSTHKTVKFQQSHEAYYDSQSPFHENATHVPVTQEAKISLRTVQFENDFGKIKAKVEQLVEHEHAFMLVFTDSDAVVFEPKAGETLLFSADDYDVCRVYYPGVTFNWPVSDKRFMILFKLPEENQE
jgi:hypothetical protein